MKLTYMAALMGTLAALTTITPAMAGPIDLRTLAGTSTAAGTPGVSTVWASSVRSDGGGRAPSGVSNGNGMTWTDAAWTGGDASGTHGVTPDPNQMWLSSGDQAPQNNQLTTTQFIGWNLGAVYTLDKVHVWNYNESGGGRGINSLDIETSVDGINWTTALSSVDWSTHQATGAGDPGFDQSLTGISTQYIRFTNLINFSSEVYVGLSEVVFYEVDAVPEPSSFALAGLGLLGLGWFGLLRRKG